MLNYAQKNLDTKNSDVSPVTLRLMKAPERNTLSREERALLPRRLNPGSHTGNLTLASHPLPESRF